MPELDQFRVFVSLMTHKRDLEAQLRQVNEEIGKQKEALFPVFAENPRLKISVDGMTVYLTRRFAAKLKEGVDREKAADVLRAWVPEMVKWDFNLNTLSAYIREQVKEGGHEDFVSEMPEAVSECFEVKDWFDINAVSVSN